MEKNIEKAAKLAAIFCFLVPGAHAQNVTITSFHINGQLSWTNAVDSNALYRIEWASQAEGPWHRTFDNIGSIDGHMHEGFTVPVPMLYRVVMATNPPPEGMAWIDGGAVALGQSGILGPVHTNFISGFWMDATEVRYGKWREVHDWAITNGYDFDHPGAGKANNHPVHSVYWYDCVKWCNARSQFEGLRPCYYVDSDFSGIYQTGTLAISNSWVDWTANGYRLPTEAEWEKAARGGRQGRLFPWGGDTIQHTRANYYATTNLFSYDVNPTDGYHPDAESGDYPYTTPVGCLAGNGYGLHDMAGNVWEWCWDWSGGYSAAYVIDPRGPENGRFRVLRGGAWDVLANDARVAQRVNNVEEYAEPDTLGFRCAKSR